MLSYVQYSQKTVFSFEKDSNRRNHYSPGSLPLAKKFPPVKFSISNSQGRFPPHLTTIWKTLQLHLNEIAVADINEAYSNNK